jgi:hypothetical protein
LLALISDEKSPKVSSSIFLPTRLGPLPFVLGGGAFTKHQKKLHHGKVMIGSQIENVLEHQGLRLKENESVEGLGARTH